METTDLHELIAALLAGRSTPAQGNSSAREVAEVVAAMITRPSTEVAARTPAESDEAEGGSGITGVVGRSLVSGFGVFSMFRSLFGGNGETKEPAAQRFSLPQQVQAAIAFDSAKRAFTTAEYTHTGQVRTAEPAPTQVTVNVQAMDSRSFSEHSHEIARAVKEAMLNAHSLNDVIGEL